MQATASQCQEGLSPAYGTQLPLAPPALRLPSLPPPGQVPLPCSLALGHTFSLVLVLPVPRTQLQKGSPIKVCREGFPKAGRPPDTAKGTRNVTI